MTIKELLARTQARIVLGDRWLVLTGTCYCIFESKPYARKSKIVYEGDNESEAITALYCK